MNLQKEIASKQNLIIKADCFDAMKLIPDGSVDMILADLPYGTTACKWDSVLPLDELWREYKRIIKQSGVIALTAGEPFTSKLITSNLKEFKYKWTWIKKRPTGFANAKKRPLKLVEDVCIFGTAKSQYNPQGLIKINKTVKNSKNKGGNTTGRFNYGESYTQEFTNYPKDVIELGLDEGAKLHPTQKPVALFEYLIKTYTNEGDLVLDNTAGVLTTAVACENTNRQYIVIEKEQEYIDKGKTRLSGNYKYFEV